ncbi:hypothetical protein D3C75_1070060 [compost metagenome]
MYTDTAAVLDSRLGDGQVLNAGARNAVFIALIRVDGLYCTHLDVTKTHHTGEVNTDVCLVILALRAGTVHGLDSCYGN